MKTKIIEVTQPHPAFNWGKFMVLQFDDEWWHTSLVDEGARLLKTLGWGLHHVLVVDLQTGEGAFFALGGSAHHDLNDKRVRVCVLFEAFLEWLYTQEMDLDALPGVVELDAPPALYGYRRSGNIVSKTLEDLPALCKHQRQALGLSLQKAADVIGINRTTLYDFEDGARSNMDTVLAIVRWLESSG
jgi:DNA-binding XRE family transcriptional regulator